MRFKAIGHASIFLDILSNQILVALQRPMFNVYDDWGRIILQITRNFGYLLVARRFIVRFIALPKTACIYDGYRLNALRAQIRFLTKQETIENGKGTRIRSFGHDDCVCGAYRLN